ncbi:MAG: precorrin-4 C(11)-methyltransferase [Rhodospirillales bacterium]
MTGGAKKGTVHFIGAGPGAADLITVRGLNLIRAADAVLYAGSLVPEEIVAEAKPGAAVRDTAPLHLDQIIALVRETTDAGGAVARVHSGDPSLYGAVAEQMRRLDELGVEYDVTPGVPAYAAMAAVMKKELTLPGVCQSVVLTRTAVRASSMPPGEDLAAFAKTGAMLAVHLSINNLAHVVRALTPFYGAACPVAVGHRVGWPDEAFVTGTLADIRSAVKRAGFTRTALIMAGPALGETAFEDSRLYAAAHSHVLRPSDSQST